MFGAVQSCSYLFVGVDLVVEEHGDVDVVGVWTTQTFRQTVTLGPREQVRGILHSHVEQLTGSLPEGCRQVVYWVLRGGGSVYNFLNYSSYIRIMFSPFYYDLHNS